MILYVYKGFSKDFLSKLDYSPLSEKDIDFKLNYKNLNNDYAFELGGYIYTKQGDRFWITYEEFELIHEQLYIFANTGRIKIKIVCNNTFPGIYPIHCNIDEDTFQEYIKHKDEERKQINQNIQGLDNIYSNIYLVNEQYYATYYNYEFPNNANIDEIINYYENDVSINPTESCDYVIDIGDNLERYLEHYQEIISNNYQVIGYKQVCNTEISNMMLESLKALLKSLNINTLYKYSGEYPITSDVREELKRIGTKLTGIADFNFRKLSFYKDPDLSDEMEEISQAEIMEYIVSESEKAYEGKRYRDIFMTAPTGAGKSLIFQLPSIYLSEKYNKLIIIIEPLKGLMQNQYDILTKSGYKKHAYLNSDIATIVQREEIINNVKEGKIDILYVSPETLLSHSIDSLIGEREIGLIIIDEAHIVTTWGVGFRPDYWYLGTYINRLRTMQNKFGQSKRHHDFPIFACTATAVNGGKDDTVSETIISLFMNDPIKKIGSAKRKNITFEINNYTDKSYDQYKDMKVQKLGERINKWIDEKDKTIVYCPYSSIAHQIYNGEKEFTSFKCFKEDIRLYTGSGEEAEEKTQAMDDFTVGKSNVMVATKAFGMGIDIPDIHNVFHYAVTGGLSDYIQEIGRAARDKNIQGKAIVDYFNGDMKYVNTLFGMSQIKQYHVKKCLSIIYDTYINKKHRNFMINPKMFDGVFGKSSQADLENKLKIVLLMLEKDFYETYKIYVLISRPGTMFTKAYVSVLEENISEIENSRYGKYFTKIANGRNREAVGGCLVTDPGPIYEVDLKSIWENIYGSEMSFASFKYKFFNKNSTDVMGDIKNDIYYRVKLGMKAKAGLLSEVYQKAMDEINYLTDVLTSFERNFFTKDEFKNKITSRYSGSKAEIIANSYFDVIDLNYECIVRREDNEIEKYQISNGKLRTLATQILSKASLIKNIRYIDKEEYEQFYADNVSDSNALKLLSVLDLVSYEIVGGNSPEIFVRLNAPDKIKNIVEDRVIYKNNYVEMAKDKHYRSVKILDYFFRHYTNEQNDDRWNFVEKYFLGEDIENEIDNMVTNENKITKHPERLEKYIDVNGSGTYSLEDYDSWKKIGDNLVTEEKYKYYCNLLNNKNKKIADYAYTDINISGLTIKTLFIYANENLIISPEYNSFEVRNKCFEKDWKIITIDEIEKNLDLIPDNEV